MKVSLLILIALCSFLSVQAQSADSLKEVKRRIKQLEYKIRQIEIRGCFAEPTKHAQKMMVVAREHDIAERKAYKQEDIANVENLYRKASSMDKGEGYRELLDSIVKMYPQMNRAGCAQLYRAQADTGKEKERLLIDCRERFNNCYYFDGAQVGPLATLQLAWYYRGIGREHEARKLIKWLRRKSPGAVDHSGVLLKNRINKKPSRFIKGNKRNSRNQRKEWSAAD